MRKGTALWAAFALILNANIALSACEGTDLIAALAPEHSQALHKAAANHVYAQGNFFKAERDQEVVHLLGTMHLPDPRHDALLARALPQLEGAKTLLVEAGPEQEAKLQAEILTRPEMIAITEGPTLSKLLSPEEWTALSEQLRAHGIPPALGAKFRPWYLSMMLGMPPCAIQAIKEGRRGLDHMLIEAARQRDIPLRPLEPYDTLFSLFGDMTIEEEIEMIRASLLAAPDATQSVVTTANAYFAGHSRLMWEFTIDQALSSGTLSEKDVRSQFAAMEEAMVTKRNQAWIPVIEEAASEGPVLAAFGALHLPGQNGVLALLEARGFKITRLD